MRLSIRHFLLPFLGGKIGASHDYVTFCPPKMYRAAAHKSIKSPNSNPWSIGPVQNYLQYFHPMLPGFQPLASATYSVQNILQWNQIQTCFMTGSVLQARSPSSLRLRDPNFRLVFCQTFSTHFMKQPSRS